MKFFLLTAMAGMTNAKIDELLNDTLGKTLGPGVANSVSDRLEYKFRGPYINIADDENVKLDILHWVLDGKLFF